jgi:hypothetical protein
MCDIFPQQETIKFRGSSMHASPFDPKTSASATMMPINDFAPRLSVLHIVKVYYPDLCGGAVSVIRNTCAGLSSPIIWLPEIINQDSTIMRFNPLTHLFAVWREPLALGHVAMTGMIYVLVCFAALALASLVAIVDLRRAAFWI